MVFEETDNRFMVGPSRIPGAGWGVFAAMPLESGDRLRVLGVLVQAGTLADRCTQYADAYKFRVGEYVLLPIGLGGMVNHSSENPNMKKVLEGTEVYLQAIRPIAAGEELLYVYSDHARRYFEVSVARSESGG